MADIRKLIEDKSLKSTKVKNEKKIETSCCWNKTKDRNKDHTKQREGSVNYIDHVYKSMTFTILPLDDKGLST